MDENCGRGLEIAGEDDDNDRDEELDVDWDGSLFMGECRIVYRWAIVT